MSAAVKTKPRVPELRFPEFVREWEEKRLGDISETVTSGSRDWAQYYSKTGAKFIRMTNLPRNGIDLLLDDLKFVQLPPTGSEGARTSLSAGDILISITAELGKVGLVPDSLGEAYINQHTALVKPLQRFVSSNFLAQQLATKASNKRLNRLNDAGAKSALNLSTVRAFPVRTPTLPEQEKIAGFLGAVDGKLVVLRDKHKGLERFKRGLMQKLFSRTLRFTRPDGTPYPDWEEKRLEDVTSCLDNKRKPLNSTERAAMQGPYPYYGANGEVDRLSKYIFDEPLVLLAEDGGNFDQFATRPIAQNIRGKCWVNNHAHIISANKGEVSQDFLFYSLVHKDIRKFINGSSRAKLNKSDMLSIPLVLPSLEEQQKIADALTALDAKIAAVSDQITRLETFKRGLLQKMFV